MCIFNMLIRLHRPAHEMLNRHRGKQPYDTEDEKATPPPHIPLKSVHKDIFGLDDEEEWVLPRRARGDVARSILYMSLVYQLPLDAQTCAIYRKWARNDWASKVEKHLQKWVQSKYRINNPLIEQPELLKDDRLFSLFT